MQISPLLSKPHEETQRLFMTPKLFAAHVGVSYGLVRDWIRQGLPVEPDHRSPYYIFVPAAMEWIKKKYWSCK